MKLLLVILLINLIPPNAAVAQTALKQGKPRSLFNGKNLDGWETYLDKPNNEIVVDKAAPQRLNHDPSHVFSVITVDGEPALRVSGEIYGGINTLAEFENYHLRLEFKWGQLKWPPKLDQPRDSGLLYHSVGAHGTRMLWMESFEFQIQEGDTGDYWGVMNVLADIPAGQNNEGKYVYKPGSLPLLFQEKTANGRTCLKSLDNEKPSGQWNTIDLYCYGSTCVHVINGKVNNVLLNTRHLVNGQAVPLTKGKIQIQSEGAEVFYRHISVEVIDRLPVGLVP